MYWSPLVWKYMQLLVNSLLVIFNLVFIWSTPTSSLFVLAFALSINIYSRKYLVLPELLLLMSALWLQGSLYIDLPREIVKEHVGSICSPPV